MNDTVRDIRIEDYTYILPEERIAKYPLEQRDSCKLLFRDNDSSIRDLKFNDIVNIIPSDAALIYNNSKVINARIKFRKGEKEDGALIEIFCLDPFQPQDYERIFSSNQRCRWQCFVGNSKRWKEGAVLRKSQIIDRQKITLCASRISHKEYTSIIEFTWDDPRFTFSQIIGAVGELPIPPYLNRSTEASDINDYQTVYSKWEGSVAAPTAGLHFTDQTLEELGKKGVELRDVVLHVGAGTFQPVNAETIGNHTMHYEYISVKKSLLRDILEWKCPENGLKIFAVGTTSVRTLESLYYIGCLVSQNKWDGKVPQWYAYSEECPKLSLEESIKYILENIDGEEVIAETQLLIAPGFTFRVIDGMITNFHQPSSTLLLLVSAFLGRRDRDWNRWRTVYEHALNHDYRFLSYGDACLFL